MLDAMHDDGLAAPAGAALVRVLATGGEWIHRLPDVPDGREVTVAIGTTAHREVADLDLLRSGYRIVGPQPQSHLPRGVELLVTADLMTEHPRWWRALLEQADAAFDLRLGPVQRVMGTHLTPHLTD
jgi:hypothetical protein